MTVNRKERFDMSRCIKNFFKCLVDLHRKELEQGVWVR